MAPEQELDRYRRAKAIFLTARRKPRAAREAFVDSVCAGDPDLRRDVDSLLQFLDAAEEPSARSLNAALPVDPPPARVAGYRIVRKIGEGGMGEVYEAEQEGALCRTVALKVVRWGLDTRRVVARFESERRAVALMNHPAIAQIFDAGATERGRPYFAMEYVPGQPITDYCDRHRFDLRRRLKLFLQTCAGVEHAHRRGVIHRDIKPSNVLVTTRDGEPAPKLIDFGVASATEQRLTESTLYTQLGEWIGTPDYMSPEQAGMEPHDVDRRSDVYSLGVLLYELLVGVRPIGPEALRASGFDEMRRRIREQEPPRPSLRFGGLGEGAEAIAAMRRQTPSGLAVELRSDLDWIVMRALEKDRRRRYPSVAALAADLERFLCAEPVEARAPSPGYRLAKFIRRHRPAVAAGALAATTLCAGVAVTLLWLGGKQPGIAARAVAPAAAEASIAVLPLVDLSGEVDDYLADGLTEGLLVALARIDGLRVAARTSSFAYQGTDEDRRAIGATLGVASVLEGSVRRAGDTLFVDVRLVRVSDGLHLWSGQLDRPVGELLAVQDEIAWQVAEALRVSDPARAGPDPRASTMAEVFDLYLSARRQLRSKEPAAIRASLVSLERAVRLDPSFAPAHSALAEGYISLARRGDLPMETAERQAGASLTRALELDSELAEAHATLGQLRFTMGDLAGAESALRRALELNDDLAAAYLRLGEVLASRDRRAEAEAIFERALALDPLNLGAHHAMANHWMNGGRYTDGMRQFQGWLRIEPDSAETYRRMALYARTYGRLDDAVRWGRRAVELGPDAPLNLHELVMAYSGLGEYDEASVWMERAFELAPNNHWTVTLKGFVLLERGDYDGLEEFAQRQLESVLPLTAGQPLAQGARVRLALAGLSKVYGRDYAAAAELYELALGEPFVGVLELGVDADALAFLALAYAELGRSDDAAAARKRCLGLIASRRDWIWSHLIMPETIASIHALEGRTEEAMATLREAVADGWLSRSVLTQTPHFEPLRGRTDFRRLVEDATARLDAMRASVVEPSSPAIGQAPTAQSDRQVAVPRPQTQDVRTVLDPSRPSVSEISRSVWPAAPPRQKSTPTTSPSSQSAAKPSSVPATGVVETPAQLRSEKAASIAPSRQEPSMHSSARAAPVAVARARRPTPVITRIRTCTRRAFGPGWVEVEKESTMRASGGAVGDGELELLQPESASAAIHADTASLAAGLRWFGLMTSLLAVFR